MSIVFHKADSSFRLQRPSILKEWISSAVLAEKKQLGAISIILCSDEYLLQINRQFLEHDYYTDIVTFDYTVGERISGELYVSSDRVIDNASKNGVPEQNEIQRVIIHGIMHLCGYKDKKISDQKTMRNKEDFYLQKLEKILRG